MVGGEEQGFDVRFWGALRVVKHVHPAMKDRGRFGSITLTSVRPFRAPFAIQSSIGADIPNLRGSGYRGV